MRNVTNEEFERALENGDNRRVISSVTRRYSKSVPQDELKQRGRIALFRCMQEHDDIHGTKFTSSLHRHTKWECGRALRDILRNPPLPELTFEYELAKTIPMEIAYVRDCLEVLPKKHSDILKSYYIQGMTLKEIGEENGYTAPAAISKLRKAEEAFRRLYGEY